MVRADKHRVAQLKPGIRQILMGRIELDVAEPVHVHDVSDEHAVLDTGAGQVESPKLRRVRRAPRVGQSIPGRKPRGNRREDVAPVEGRRHGLQAPR